MTSLGVEIWAYIASYGADILARLLLTIRGLNEYIKEYKLIQFASSTSHDSPMIRNYVRTIVGYDDDLFIADVIPGSNDSVWLPHGIYATSDYVMFYSMGVPDGLVFECKYFAPGVVTGVWSKYEKHKWCCNIGSEPGKIVLGDPIREWSHGRLIWSGGGKFIHLRNGVIHKGKFRPIGVEDDYRIKDPSRRCIPETKNGSEHILAKNGLARISRQRSVKSNNIKLSINRIIKIEERKGPFIWCVAIETYEWGRGLPSGSIFRMLAPTPFGIKFTRGFRSFKLIFKKCECYFVGRFRAQFITENAQITTHPGYIRIVGDDRLLLCISKNGTTRFLMRNSYCLVRVIEDDNGAFIYNTGRFPDRFHGVALTFCSSDCRGHTIERWRLDFGDYEHLRDNSAGHSHKARVGADKSNGYVGGQIKSYARITNAGIVYTKYTKDSRGDYCRRIKTPNLTIEIARSTVGTRDFLSRNCRVVGNSRIYGYSVSAVDSIVPKPEIIYDPDFIAPKSDD